MESASIIHVNPSIQAGTCMFTMGDLLVGETLVIHWCGGFCCALLLMVSGCWY
jgi:hypothetical protein